MPLFYTGQTDYIAQLNVVAATSLQSAQTASSTGAQTKTIDLSLGNVFYLTISASAAANVTLALSNLPNGGVSPFELTIFVKYTTTFAHTIIWPVTPTPTKITQGPAAQNPFAPVLTATNGRTDIFRLHYPGGSINTYYGEIVGQNYVT